MVTTASVRCLAAVANSARELNSFEIAQEMTFERQAFEATMTIGNAVTDEDLSNVGVTVIFKDKNGLPVSASTDPNSTTAKFFYNISSLKNIANVSGTGSVPKSSSSEIILRECEY